MCTRQHLKSYDVSTAYLKGEPYEELSADSRQLRREPTFMLPGASDWQILYDLCRMTYSPLALHFLEELVLLCLKGGYGLKDAPRMWRRALHKFLTSPKMRFIQSVWDECWYHRYEDWVLDRYNAAQLRQLLQRTLEEEMQAAKKGEWRRDAGSDGSSDDRSSDDASSRSELSSSDDSR